MDSFVCSTYLEEMQNFVEYSHYKNNVIFSICFKVVEIFALQ